MPNRLIRDEMLESESILSLPIEARWLYVTILLSADDVGLFEATSFKLARRADIRRESGDKLIQLLADNDLIRLYEVDGKRYGFIPKFRQRLQIKRSKYPHPPGGLLADDLDALNKINELGTKTTVVQQRSTVPNPLSTVAQPPEPEPEPEPEKKKPNTRTSTVVECFSGVDPQVWNDWLAIRKAKKLPLTKTAMAQVEAEVKKAGISMQEALKECCLRGWGGFKASWYVPAPTLTVPSAPMRDPALVKIEEDSLRKVAPPPEIRQMLNSIIKKV